MRPEDGSDPAGALAVLVVDDEQPACDELSWLLRRDPRVGSVVAAGSAAEALRVLQEQHVDVLFCDIHMPGLSGLELAQVLARFREPPQVVFVTAHDEHAVEAFELHVADYLLKPVRESRLAEAVRRVVQNEAQTEAQTESQTDPQNEGQNGGPLEDSIPVELAGVTRFVRRSEVRYVEAQGDYTRLHTPAGTSLIRVPLSTLEQEWRDAGFVRIHRSHLVALAHVDEVRSDGGRVTVVVGGEELAVSRRHTRELRDLLVGRARPGRGGERS